MCVLQHAVVSKTGDWRPPFARQICVRFASSRHDQPGMCSPAHASKATSANQLPALLSAKRTSAFWSALLAA